MMVGGSAAMQRETLATLQQVQQQHGEAQSVVSDDFTSLVVLARGADAACYADDAIVVSVTGYVTALGDHDEAVQGPQWLALLWRKFGPEALNQVDGDYAAVILDKRQQRLYAVAGPTAIYPLFIARHRQDHNAWVVGSEPKAVLQAAGLQAEMNAAAVVQHLFYLGTLLVPHATPYRGVERIPAGCFASWHADATDRIEQRAFWRPEDIEVDPGQDRTHLLRTLHAAIEESVMRCLPATGNTALALSGGMDSSSIWAVLRDHAARGCARSGAVRAFSHIYPGTPSDEQVYIDENHRHWGTVGCYRDIAHERITDSDEVLLSILDFPLSGGAGYTLRLLAEDLAGGGMQTMLSGFSGDFWLNIYPPYYQADLLRRGAVSEALMPVWSAWRRRESSTSGMLRWAFNIFLPRGSAWRRRLRPPRLPAAMTRDYRYLMEGAEQWFSERALVHGYAKAQMLYMRETQWRSSFIPLNIVQVLAQAGIVLRDPLGSRRLMEWALSVPPYEVAGDLEKAFMRQAMSPLLPPLVRDKDFPTFHGGDSLRNHVSMRDLGEPGTWLLCQSGLLSAAALRKASASAAGRFNVSLERFAMTEAFCRRQFGA